MRPGVGFPLVSLSALGRAASLGRSREAVLSHDGIRADPEREVVNSTWLELAAVLAAILAFRGQWRGQVVLLHCDNLGVSQTWRTGYSQSLTLAGLVREVAAVAAAEEIDLRIV